MRPVAFLIPGNLQSRTGGYGYDRRIITELQALGWSVDVQRLDSSYPEPTVVGRQRTAAILAACQDDALVLVDGLAFGAMAEEAEFESERLRLIALVHHPLANETGIRPELARTLAVSERRALACARLVVVTSRATVRSVVSYGVEPSRIVVVEPGTDPGRLARGPQLNGFRMLCVASVTPRKGYETLVAALTQITDLEWRVTCVGSLERAPDTAALVQQLVADAGLQQRVLFVGELGPAEVDECYDSANLFVLPTFHEGYGMVVAEAIARGLPVISTPTGAIREIIGERGGVLVPIGDVTALADAMRHVISNASYRARLIEGAKEMREKLPSWRAAAATMAEALNSLS